MMITKWKTSKYGKEIQRIECVRETDKMIVYLSEFLDREFKNIKDGYDKYHDSWADAHEYLLNFTSENIDSLKNKLASEIARLELIKSMKEPY